jgi:hypothetical protein
MAGINKTEAGTRPAATQSNLYAWPFNKPVAPALVAGKSCALLIENCKMQIEK